MVKDMFGKNRIKVNLHMHTTDSDGHRSPEEAARIYKEAGYDVIAVTDHWKFKSSGMLGGIRTISGAEYNIGGGNGADGVYHFLGIGCDRDPGLVPSDSPETIIERIRSCHGLVVLAHPAWSLNTVDQILPMPQIDATEIYNSVSDAGESARPYSGNFVDTAACRGLSYPLIADDDTHYYDGYDETKAWIMLEVSGEASDQEIVVAVREGKFYATQGPELHISRSGSTVTVQCSPVSRITFLSNMVWVPQHSFRGDGLTEATCELKPQEKFIRAEVTDAEGRMAWSNLILI